MARLESEIVPVTTERPAPGVPRAYHFPDFSLERMANGVELLTAPVRRLPLVAVRILVRAGAMQEMPEAAGTASLVARAIAEGTARLGGAELTEEFERLGSSLHVEASWDGIHIAATVVRDQFPAVARLLAEVLRTPAFPDREIARLRDERLAELLELAAEPRGLADELFTRFMYAPSSRFAWPEGGSPRTVKRLSRADIVGYFNGYFKPGSTSVIVAGDVTPDEARHVVSEVLSDWTGTTQAAPPPEIRAAHAMRTIHVVRRHGAPQTELRVGHIGLPRLHPDYFRVVVMNAILGGVFNSRINLNLRERHGYTYGASSEFDWRRHAGPFVVSTAVATDVTAAAVREILHELERMRTAPPSDEELSLVISYLEGVYPIRFETVDAIAGALASLRMFDLPDDYYDSYRRHVAAVTAMDVHEAARVHLRPDELQIVAVGDPDQIAPSLEALGVGVVRQWQPDIDSPTPVD